MRTLDRFRKRFVSSLLLKGVAATATVLTTISLGGLGVFLLIENRKLEQQFALRGESLAQYLADELQFPVLVGDPTETQRLLKGTYANEDVLFLEVWNPAGRRVCALVRPDRIASIPPPAADPGFWKVRTAVRDAGENFIEIHMPVRAPDRDRLLDWEPARKSAATLGTLRVGLSLKKERAFFRQMLFSSVSLILFGIALACTAVFGSLRRLLRPLETLVGFTRLVGAGDLGQRAPVERADEIGQLAASFNQMAARLGETTVSKDYVDNVLHSMGEALIVTDRLGRVERVNPRTEELLGYSALELMGRPAVELIAEGDAPSRKDSVQRTYRAKDGRLIPVLLSSGGLRGELGEGQVWLAQDMSELKRTEQELEHARDAAEQANRAKSVFLANMSHELRTPLNAVIGYSQMLREDCIGPGQPEVREDLAKIEQSGQMLLGIINDILDLSKIEAGRETVRAQMFDLEEVLRDVAGALQPLAEQQANVLTFECPEPARMAYGDISKFRQSLLNLVNNALKFTERGSVRVTVERACRRDGEWTEVRVTDTGIGIGGEHLGKLFQPFSQVDGSATRKYNGTGLGLAISKRFCQMMGGDITVESEPGRGSRFTIRIPAMIREGAEADA